VLVSLRTGTLWVAGKGLLDSALCPQRSPNLNKVRWNYLKCFLSTVFSLFSTFPFSILTVDFALRTQSLLCFVLGQKEAHLREDLTWLLLSPSMPTLALKVKVIQELVLSHLSFSFRAGCFSVHISRPNEPQYAMECILIQKDILIPPIILLFVRLDHLTQHEDPVS